MARVRKTLENILITGVAAKGMSVGRTEDGQVVFAKGGIPGDVVDVLVTRKKSKYSEGNVIHIRKHSDDKVAPFCSHFNDCGGCKWQNIKYDAQIAHKTQEVVAAMERMARLDPQIILPTKKAKDIKYYRNKLEYSFSNKRWITQLEADTMGEIEPQPAFGFHRPGSFEKIVDIQECFLQNDLSNDIRNFVRAFCIERQFSFYNAKSHEGFMRNMIVRNTTEGDWMVIVIFSKNDTKKINLLMNAMQQEFAYITSLMYVVNGKKNDTILDQEVVLFHGKDHIVEQLGKVKYRIGPKSFFQTNSHQAKVLFDTVVEFANFQGHENVYDLYTGLGSIALYIADKVKWVTGIEEVEEAIEDANKNAALNGIENATFYAGDVKDLLNPAFEAKHGKPDIVITDPPRAGMHDHVVQTLLALEAPKIIYVSCNAGTQARDLQLLTEKYTVVKIQPVDMFPHTHHIENVALLTLK